MLIDEGFKNQYLICGHTYDNFIFEGCSQEFLEFAKQSLQKSDNGVFSCCVAVNKEEEEKILSTVNYFDEVCQRQFLMRDYVTALIMREVLSKKYNYENHKRINNINEQIDAFLRNDYEKVKECHQDCCLPMEIAYEMRKIGKIELNIFLNDTRSVLLQQAFNNLIASREPYSIKLFTTNDKLPTYYNQSGDLIECPHDYMTRNVKQYVAHFDKSM